MEPLYNVQRDRRVTIFRRDDGRWSFVEERFSALPFEMCWIAVGHSVSICDARATALREAHGRVDWLIDEPIESDLP